MSWFSRTAGRLIHRDLSVEPDLDYYLPQADRRPLSRVRTALPLGTASLTAGLIAGLAAIGVLVWLDVDPRAVSGVAVAAVSITAAALVPWLRPGYRWHYRLAETLVPGMWVAVEMIDVVNEHERVAGRVFVTQILAVFEHGGKEFRCVVGLHCGTQWVFKPDAYVPVFELVDVFSWLRTPKHVKAHFYELELPVVAVLEILWNAACEVNVYDLVAELENRPWPYDVVWRAVDASWRLGMVNSSVRGKRLVLLDAGGVWLCSWFRQHGVELVPDAKERPYMNISNEGIMQFGNHNQAAMAGDHGEAMNLQHSEGLSARELGALEQLLTVLDQPGVRGQLHDDARETVEDEIAVISEVVQRRSPVTTAVRKSIKTILGIAGQLIIGAAGNGLYDSLKQMV